MRKTLISVVYNTGPN